MRQVSQNIESESPPGKKVRAEEAGAGNEDCARGRPTKRKARIVCSCRIVRDSLETQGT